MKNKIVIISLTFLFLSCSTKKHFETIQIGVNEKVNIYIDKDLSEEKKLLLIESLQYRLFYHYPGHIIPYEEDPTFSKLSPTRDTIYNSIAIDSSGSVRLAKYEKLVFDEDSVISFKINRFARFDNHNNVVDSLNEIVDYCKYFDAPSSSHKLGINKEYKIIQKYPSPENFKVNVCHNSGDCTQISKSMRRFRKIKVSELGSTDTIMVYCNLEKIKMPPKLKISKGYYHIEADNSGRNIIYDFSKSPPVTHPH